MTTPPMATTPYNRVLWPDEIAGNPLIWNAEQAQRIPAVARAVALYGGLIKQCPLDAYRGPVLLPRPRLLDQPTPGAPATRFVQLSVEDYLLHGNALALITARDATGWPAALMWIPAEWVTIGWTLADPAAVTYWVHGREVPAADLVHVRRGADRWCPPRGVGVIERHLKTFDRIAAQEEYERRALSDGGVPSIAVITPNPGLSQVEADAAKADWMAKFGGPSREPVIVPAGTILQPLAWSPTDADLVAARQMSLLDVANAFNLDGYWLGAPSGSMTYRSPGPMYLNLLRTSLLPVMKDLEDAWAIDLLPRGQQVQFDRLQILRDDLQTTVETMAAAVAADLYTLDEARAYMGQPALADDPQPAPDPTPDPTNTDPTGGTA